MSKKLNNSVVIFVPATVREECNMIAELMGWGPNSFSVPLTKDGENIIYYGLRSECDDTFIGWLRGEVELPPIVNRNPKIKSVLNSIVLDVSPDKYNPQKPLLWGNEHFQSVCREMGLKIMGSVVSKDLTDSEDDAITE